MLPDLLSRCGLNESERTVLMHLLTKGPSIASVIAKRTNLKRPTVYAVLDNLTHIGVVTKEKKQGALHFAAVSPAMLPRVIEQHARKQYDTVKHVTELLRPEMLKVAQSAVDIGGFEITTLEQSPVYALYEDTLLSGNFCAIFNPQTAIGTPLTKEIVEKFLRETAHSQPHIREIAVAGSMATWYRQHIHNRNHVVREIAPNNKIITDMILINGSVVLSHYDPDHEVGVKIKHPDFYRTMMTVFELLWESLGSR